jgi:hypothetical protein
LACGLLPALAQADRGYVGLATDIERGTPMYEEHHLLRGTSERLVLYRCPDGTAFARKHVRYGASALAPEFELVDVRFGYREGVQREGNSLSAYVQRDARSEVERGVLVVTPSLVVDAGFDELVRLHWDSLQRGDAVRFDFLVPSRRRSYAFSVKRIGARDIEGQPASVLRLGLDGVFGWFTPGLEVGYRDSDRRLMQFVGLTNLRENRDDSFDARIDFPTARESNFSDADWQRAANESLATCRVGNG